MVLYIIGLGLGNEKDITLKGLEAIRSCQKLYLEYYTSILGIDVTKLENFYGLPITTADRDMVETQAELIYGEAKDNNIGFLVVGDPLCATTHIDLILRAKKLNIIIEIIHNTSVMGACASCGLPLYQYGYTVSIPYFEENWKPDSFYSRIKYNLYGDMHTLCLLDIKVKEPNYESMMKYGKLVYMPPRFMTINTAIEQLFEIELLRQEKVILSSTLGVGMARLGQDDQQIVFGTLAELQLVDFGKPLHCLVICGEIHPMEQELLDYYKVKKDIEITL